MDLAGVSLDRSNPSTASPSGAPLAFGSKGESKNLGPTLEGLERVEKEARAVAEVNYLGTVLALSCFVRKILPDVDIVIDPICSFRCLRLALVLPLCIISLQSPRLSLHLTV